MRSILAGPDFKPRKLTFGEVTCYAYDQDLRAELAAGMTKVLNEERYDKLLVARPIMPMGRDIGFMPGTKDEKRYSHP